MAEEQEPVHESGAAHETLPDVQQRAMSIDDVASELTNWNILGVKDSTPEEEATPEPEPEPTPEAAPEAEEASSEPEGEEKTEDESGALTLQSVADALEIDVDMLYDLPIATKINGEEGHATLRDLQKSYQLDGHLNSRLKDVSAKERQLEQQFNERLGAKSQELETLISIMRDDLTGAIREVNWEELRDNDPPEYQRRWIEFKEREEKLNLAIQKYNQSVEERQEQQQQSYQEALREEQSKLLNVIPSWADADVRAKEQDNIKKHLVETYSLTPEEVKMVADHRYVHIIRDAVKWRELQDKKPAQLKRVRKAPTAPKTKGKAETSKSNDQVHEAMKKVRAKARARRPNLDEVAAALRAKGIT